MANVSNDLLLHKMGQMPPPTPEFNSIKYVASESMNFTIDTLFVCSNNWNQSSFDFSNSNTVIVTLRISFPYPVSVWLDTIVVISTTSRIQNAVVVISSVEEARLALIH
jgi:hypothetical protein